MIDVMYWNYHYFKYQVQLYYFSSFPFIFTGVYRPVKVTGFYRPVKPSLKVN